MPPPKYKLNKIKSFEILHPVTFFSENDVRNYDNSLHKLKSQIDENTRIHAIMKHEPKIGPDSFGRTHGGILRILGVGTEKLRPNTYNVKGFPETWEPQEWEQTRNTMKPGHLRELIYNLREHFPDINSIYGYRVTGVHARKGNTDSAQEVKLKPKK